MVIRDASASKNDSIRNMCDGVGVAVGGAVGVADGVDVAVGGADGVGVTIGGPGIM